MGFCSVRDGAEAVRDRAKGEDRVICLTRASRVDKLDICSTPPPATPPRHATYCSNASIETLIRRGPPIAPATAKPSSVHRVTSQVPRTASVRNRDGFP